MKKMFLLLALVALCSLCVTPASAKVYNFTFDTYCDGMHLVTFSLNPGVIPATLIKGYHFNYDCSNTSYNTGFKHGLHAGYQYASSGAVLDAADEDCAVYCGFLGSANFVVNPVYRTWVLYFTDGSTTYVRNFGTFTYFAGSKPTTTATKSAGQR
jgi:hypothetical protein